MTPTGNELSCYTNPEVSRNLIHVPNISSNFSFYTTLYKSSHHNRPSISVTHQIAISVRNKLVCRGVCISKEHVGMGKTLTKRDCGPKVPVVILLAIAGQVIRTWIEKTFIATAKRVSSVLGGHQLAIQLLFILGYQLTPQASAFRHLCL